MGTSKSLSAQVRDAVDASGFSRYRICKNIGVAEATMSRFMASKGGLSMASLDKLAALIGLEIVMRPKSAEAGG